MAKPRYVDVVEAESYQWWENYLNHRMIALQAQVILGKSKQEAIQVVGTDPIQMERLYDEAVRRQKELK